MSMVSNVTAATGTAAADANMKSTMGLSKDDFLKLFVAQLQNQDPLNPTSSDQLLSQMSSITLVEQSYNQNTNLANVLAAQQNATAMSAVGLVGANIKANGNAISFDGTNATPMQISLGAAASTVKVDILDANSKTVATTTTGALAAGNQTLSWDGTDSSGNKLPAGAYSYAVSATSSTGRIVPATTYTTGTVTGVSYSGSTPILMIGSAAVNLTDIINVGG